MGQFGSAGENEKRRMLARAKEQEEAAATGGAPVMDAEDEAEADRKNRERLEQVRAERAKKAAERDAAAAAAAAEADEEAKKEAAAAKASTKKGPATSSKYPEVLQAVEKLLLASGGDGKQLSLNQLNQNADAKKVLKPLLKKSGIKSLNAAALKDICEFSGSPLKIETLENVLYVSKA